MDETSEERESRGGGELERDLERDRWNDRFAVACGHGQSQPATRQGETGTHPAARSLLLIPKFQLVGSSVEPTTFCTVLVEGSPCSSSASLLEQTPGSNSPLALARPSPAPNPHTSYRSDRPFLFLAILLLLLLAVLLTGTAAAAVGRGRA